MKTNVPVNSGKSMILQPDLTPRQRHYFLDTNFLLQYPNLNAYSFDTRPFTVVVSRQVLQELDHLKLQGRLGRRIRRAIRCLDRILAGHLKLSSGLGRLVRCDYSARGSDQKGDAQILRVARRYARKNMDATVVFLTRDQNLRTLARGTELQVEDPRDWARSINQLAKRVSAGEQVGEVDTVEWADRGSELELPKATTCGKHNPDLEVQPDRVHDEEEATSQQSSIIAEHEVAATRRIVVPLPPTYVPADDGTHLDAAGHPATPASPPATGIEAASSASGRMMLLESPLAEAESTPTADGSNSPLPLPSNLPTTEPYRVPQLFDSASQAITVRAEFLPARRSDPPLPMAAQAQTTTATMNATLPEETTAGKAVTQGPPLSSLLTTTRPMSTRGPLLSLAEPQPAISRWWALVMLGVLFGIAVPVYIGGLFLVLVPGLFIGGGLLSNLLPYVFLRLLH